MSSDPSARRISVMIVEDDAQIAALHAEFLTGLPGFEVVGQAASVAGALAEIGRREPDLILLDVYLPDGTGIDLLRRLRMARPDAYDVILITAASDLAHVERAAHLGVADYLLKPFTRAEFTRRLAAYARGRETRRDVGESGPLSQAAIDARLTPAASRPMPKGLSATTCALVADVMRVGEPLTATDVSERLGISRVSARRYLEHLVHSGQVVSRPRFGGQGRPRTEYVWADPLPEPRGRRQTRPPNVQGSRLARPMLPLGRPGPLFFVTTLRRLHP